MHSSESQLSEHEQRFLNPIPCFRREPNEVSKNHLQRSPSNPRRTSVVIHTHLCQTTAPNNSPRRHIRLLDLHEHKSLDQSPHESIHRTLVKDAPFHQVWSYVWRDNHDQGYIVYRTSYIAHACNHGVTPPRESSEPVMAIRWWCERIAQTSCANSSTSRSRVDATGIDQHELHEKTVQVVRMGHTFKQAADVLICAGMHDANSKLAAAILREFGDFFVDKIGKLKCQDLVVHIAGLWQLLLPWKSSRTV